MQSAWSHAATCFSSNAFTTAKSQTMSLAFSVPDSSTTSIVRVWPCTKRHSPGCFESRCALSMVTVLQMR